MRDAVETEIDMRIRGEAPANLRAQAATILEVKIEEVSGEDSETTKYLTKLTQRSEDDSDLSQSIADTVHRMKTECDSNDDQSDLSALECLKPRKHEPKQSAFKNLAEIQARQVEERAMAKLS